jgi:PAS domain S-box-containing protein
MIHVDQPMSSSLTDEAFARGLFEAAPDALIVTDGAGRIVLANERAEGLFSYPPREIVGCPLEMVIPHITAREGRSNRIGRRKDGTEFPVEVRINPIRTATQTLCIASVRDTTERVAAMRALRETQERFRLAFEDAPHGMALMSLEGRFVRVNHALCRILGYGADELATLDFRAITHPDDLAEDSQLAARLIRGEIPSYELEKRYIRKDGQVIDGVLSISLLRDREGGTPLYCIGQIQDVTERRRGEAEIRRLDASYRTLFDLSADGIVITDLDGRYRDVNAAACRILGHSRAELLGGMAIRDVLDPADLERLAQDRERLLASGQAIVSEWNVRREDGSWLPIEVSAQILPDRRWQAQIRDISERKELERLRAEWASIVAHDLRQPLSVLGMRCELLLRQLSADAGARRPLEEMRRTVQQLGRMVGDLMDLSRLEARRLELVREWVDVADLARASVERHPHPADRPVEVRVLGDVPKCPADPDRVAQVMDNLLSNAVKYGSPDTPILVEVAPAEGGVSVAVTNDGPGIPPQDLQRVFDRFERAERRGSIKGMGLGLYITRGLVEAHGGRIGVRSRAGRTTFEFVLPAA